VAFVARVSPALAQALQILYKEGRPAAYRHQELDDLVKKNDTSHSQEVRQP